MEDSINTLAYLVGITAVYFIPALRAYSRRHHQRTAILATNILLGWTFIGWAVAFIWSCTAIPRELAQSTPVAKGKARPAEQPPPAAQADGA